MKNKGNCESRGHHRKGAAINLIAVAWACSEKIL